MGFFLINSDLPSETRTLNQEGHKAFQAMGCSPLLSLGIFVAIAPIHARGETAILLDNESQAMNDGTSNGARLPDLAATAPAES